MRIIRLAFVLLLLVSCSKKEDGAPAVEASSSLMAWLPGPTTAFSYIDFGSGDYQRWKKSVYGELGYMLQDASTNMMQASGAQIQGPAKNMMAVMDAMKTSGLMLVDKTQTEPVREMLYFSISGPDGGAALASAYFFTAAPGVNLKDKLTVFENSLKAKGLNPVKGGFAPAENFSLDLNDPNASAEEKAMSDKLGWGKTFVYATQDKMAVSNSQLLAEKYFTGTASSAFLNSPKYKAVEKFLPAKGSSHFGVGYFDFKALIQNFGAIAPPAEQAQIQENLKNAPIGPIVGYATMQDHPMMRYSMVLQPSTDAHRATIAALKSSGNIAVLKTLPMQALFALALDGGALKAVKATAMNEMPPEQREMAAAQFAILDSVQGVTLGAANASGASPFPEIFAIVSSSSAAELKGMVQGLAEMGAAQGGMPSAPWQKKEISGVQVDFTLTPLGIGVYLGETSGSLFIASSEAMATNIIATLKDPSQGLAAKVAQLKLDGTGHLFAGYMDFVKLFDLIQTLQGTLAMFTGGQSNMDMKQFEILKKLGSGSVDVVANDDAVTAEMHMHAP